MYKIKNCFFYLIEMLRNWFQRFSFISILILIFLRDVLWNFFSKLKLKIRRKKTKDKEKRVPKR